MKSIGIVIPYYGRFPNYFNLFLKSCGENPTIDWLIFTDIDDVYDYPENVHWIYMTFDELRCMFQSKFDFSIVLNDPYKLCDFKPAYGYIFEAYIKKYDFWGYCDIDMMFGNLRKFLPDIELNKFDKIGDLGHLSLYRNNTEMNVAFMSEIDGVARYKEVFTTPQSCIFDEWDGLTINKILLLKNKRILKLENVFDVYPYNDNFIRVVRHVEDKYPFSYKEKFVRKNTFITWEKGSIYAWQKTNRTWEKTEYAYAHFQKRSMSIEDNIIKDQLLCVPDKFITYEKYIPYTYVIKGYIRCIFNIKRSEKIWKGFLYFLIEKSAPIRRKLTK